MATRPRVRTAGGLMGLRFCRHCWREERAAGATMRIAWQVARGKRP